MKTDLQSSCIDLDCLVNITLLVCFLDSISVRFKLGRARCDNRLFFVLYSI